MTARLPAESTAALLELAKGADGFLAELKSDPGRLGLDTLLEEIIKLRRAKVIGLPADLFGVRRGQGGARQDRQAVLDRRGGAAAPR
ncbi:MULTISPECIES: hypothetical protein [Streptosporangium]|uniref:Uncharacterized protein n=1 Tax=Streptosporangium brasiliense TaxID=47480 RepID=A0ABT9RHN5_9ACTN|nr:hypothetical protein [Streptosporangium brasiliense]MDP9868598.1 hypothetical protein [Streptosporangium brasiliense]